MKIKKMFFLAIYYGFAYYLPATNANWLGRIGGGFAIGVFVT